MCPILPFVLMALTMLYPSSQNHERANASCTQAGLVFGIHSFGSSIVLKDPKGTF
jgi:hypothetical protein